MTTIESALIQDVYSRLKKLFFVVQMCSYLYQLCLNFYYN